MSVFTTLFIYECSILVPIYGILLCIAEEDKEDDIQIGFPTDVKHVAHIGWDGPAVDSPSWVGIIILLLMNEYEISIIVEPN